MGDKGKLSLYDLSFRTPIIFSWKNRIKPNIRLEDLVHSADIPATILDIVNLEKEEDYFGISLKSQIMKGKQGIRKNIIGKSKKIRDDNDPMGKDVEAYWARENEWFYSLNKTDDIELLFDVEKDPLCNLNLSTKYPELVSSFRYKIELAYQKTD
jgi:arylsulfatase A-like enzyme